MSPAILFFAAAVASPHMFYIIFNENNDPKALTLASWGLPLYFLLLSLPVFPILWARHEDQFEYAAGILSSEPRRRLRLRDIHI